jgi:gas vesicle protein GvpL/GvpF
VIEVYAIARHPGPPLPDAATPLRELKCDDLAVVCGHGGDDHEITPEALWRHETIIETLMETRDVLPLRYGTRFERDAEAVGAVAGRRDDLHAALDRVRGAVELSLRVRAHERADTADVETRLRPLAREAVVRPGRDEGELMRAAYLVDRSRVEAVRQEVERLQADRPDLGLLLTGPWPPYSFAER